MTLFIKYLAYIQRYQIIFGNFWIKIKLWVLRIKWSVSIFRINLIRKMFTDHLIRKAPSDFRQRFPPSPATLEQKKVRFTVLTSTVDAQTSSTTVALRGSFLKLPRQPPQRRRRRGTKKTCKQWRRRRRKKKQEEEEAGRWSERRRSRSANAGREGERFRF